MEVLKAKISNAFHHTPKEHSVETPDSIHLRETGTEMKNDYCDLLLNTNKFIHAVHDFQFKWETFSYIMRSFGAEQYVDSRAFSRMAEINRELQVLLTPMIQTTKSGLWKEAENIYKTDVNQLKKSTHKLNNSLAVANHLNGKYVKLNEKKNVDPTKLEKYLNDKQNAEDEYLKQQKEYAEMVKKLELQSDSLLIEYVQKLINEIAVFYKKGFEIIDKFYQEEFPYLPQKETLHSKLYRMNLNTADPQSGITPANSPAIVSQKAPIMVPLSPMIIPSSPISSPMITSTSDPLIMSPQIKSVNHPTYNKSSTTTTSSNPLIPTPISLSHSRSHVPAVSSPLASAPVFTSEEEDKEKK